MTTRLLGSGEVDEIPRADETVRLQREIAALERELAEARSESQNAKQLSSDAREAIANLRKQLAPLYNALKMIFGEISRVDVGDHTEETSTARPTHQSTVWRSWMQKLGGRRADFIGLLLEHGEMTQRQLMAAAKCGATSARDTIYRLTKAQLIDRRGDKYALKNL